MYKITRVNDKPRAGQVDATPIVLSPTACKRVRLMVKQLEKVALNWNSLVDEDKRKLDKIVRFRKIKAELLLQLAYDLKLISKERE